MVPSLPARRARASLFALMLVAGPLVQQAGAFSIVGDTADILGGESQIRPQDLGEAPPDGLTYGDPAEGLDLVQVPIANNNGSAQLSFPVAIPAGRGGTQPAIELTYDSGGGAGWAGLGWDVGVSGIEVDSRWGVPRYDTNKESETYQLDGKVLSPTAVRSAWENRRTDPTGKGEIFTLRVDTDYERIRRHGSKPGDYWWEIADKVGGYRFYGAIPTYDPATGVLSATRDPNSILTDANGNEARWGLTAQVDVSFNIVRYHYQKRGYVFGSWQTSSAASPSGGTAMWLRRIEYTGTLVGEGTPDDPAYEVWFLRDGDSAFVGDGSALSPRKDIELDARHGFLESTPELLRAIEVVYRPGEPNPALDYTDTGSLARAYELKYRDGGAAKSLLSAIKVIGDDGASYEHTFTYYQDVGENGDYKGGFGPYEGDGSPKVNVVGSESDDLHEFLLFKDAKYSQLGSSISNSGDFHLYLGYNPTVPKKLLSYGGAISIGGGTTYGLSELIDINGDLLPDKVFRADVDEIRDGKIQPATIYYRLRLKEPDASGNWFGAKHPIDGLDAMSSDGEFSIGGGPEAYPGVAVQFSISGSVSIGYNYFADVNNDGLVDFIKDGVVLFNYLNNGVPTFTKDSSKTSVPIDDATLVITTPKKLQELQDQQRKQSPQQDTVRRWLAPRAGTVEITGDVSFEPPLKPGETFSGDGIKVAIETWAPGDPDQATVNWSTTLADAGDSATPTGVDSISVVKGQAIYFRVQAGEDGQGTEAHWDPLIKYLYANPADEPPLDVNGLSQVEYDSSADFTTAGRPGTSLFLPVRGEAHLDGTLSKARATTDEVRIEVTLNGNVIHSATVPAAFVGDTDVSHDFDVPGPVSSGNPPVPTFDKLQVRVVTDSPIDLTALGWAPRLWYLTAFDGEGNPIDTFDEEVTPPAPNLTVEVPVDMDIFGDSSLTGASEPWTSDLDETVTIHGVIKTEDSPGGRAVLTVKTRDGIVGKQDFQLPDDDASRTTTVDLDVTIKNGVDYWFDFSVTDPALSGAVAENSVELQWDDNGPQTRSVPSAYWSTGAQSIFPVPYRGWGYAGYNGDGDRANAPITPSSFTISNDTFDEATAPTKFNDPDYNDPTVGQAFAFIAATIPLLNDAGQSVGRQQVWRGSTDDNVGGASISRAARPGASFSIAANSGDQRAPRLISVGAPSFGLSGGALVFGGGISAGWDFGLVDYMDLNGDGYPDVVTPTTVQYSGPRGGLIQEVKDLDPLVVLSQDTGFGFSGGFNGSAPEAKGGISPQRPLFTSNKGSNPGTKSSGGEDASADEAGVQLGGSIGYTYGIGNPVLSDPEAYDNRVKVATDSIPDVEAYLEEKIGDMNGDGLPDKIRVNNDGIFVRFNLGYGFDTNEVQWVSGGGYETGESHAGSVGPTFGFAMPYREFAGGLAYNEDLSLSLYAWVDINGDGIADRVRRDKADERVYVAFGSGTGIRPEVDYGDVLKSSFDLTGTSTGQQIAASRTRGAGGGFDFTIALGPLCLPTTFCYIIINPGAHYEHSISTTNLQMVDVDGDGLPDSVASEKDNEMTVRRNSWGRTNLLHSVLNPLGGEIRIGYERDGNTPDQPYPVWNMSSVQVDDNRAGDGPDTQVSTFDYGGNAFNSLEREFLGYTNVVRKDHDPGSATPWDDADLTADELEAELEAMPVLRSVEQEYLNDTVFHGGLLTRETMRGHEPDNDDPEVLEGLRLRETVSEWEFVDPRTADPVDLRPSEGDPAGVRFLEMAASPHMGSLTKRWFATDGSVGESTTTTFTYNDRGDVTIQADEGEPETTADDVVAEIVYSSCTQPGEFGDLDLPITFTLYHPLDGGGRELLKKRDGGDDICSNGAPTIIREWYGPGADEFVVTAMGFDTWGNYDCIWVGASEVTIVDDNDTPNDPTDDTTYQGYTCRPGFENADDVEASYRVVYDFDAERHTDIAMITDSHGLSASATYVDVSGALKSQTDANNAVTSYEYDGLGRLEHVIGPLEQGTGHKTIEFDYHPDAPDYAYAVAKHYDRYANDPANTIDTVRFFDGIGRETETKADGNVAGVGPGTGTDVFVVAGAVEFDALGRSVKQWYPTTQPVAGNIGVYSYLTSDPYVSITKWDDADRVISSITPDGKETKRAYDFADADWLGAKVFRQKITDPLGHDQFSWFDVRDNLLAVDQQPTDVASRRRTTYEYDPVGQLIKTTDPAGNETTHTYDLVAERLTTTTPDGGTITEEYDNLGNVVVRTTPNDEADGGTSFTYDHDRLIFADYPDGTPDVEYEYGGPGAGGNGAGRITVIDDGSRHRTFEYDKLGYISVQHDTMKLQQGGIGDLDLMSSMEHDGLGRLRSLTYPDGEKVTYEFDSGGLVRSATGAKGAFTYNYVTALEYDEFGQRRFQSAGNGASTAWDYHPGHRRLVSQVTIAGTQTVQNLAYDYDDIGNLKKAVNTILSPQANFKGGTSTQLYDYDPFNRLKGSTGVVNEEPKNARSYCYAIGIDGSGLISSKTQIDEEKRATDPVAACPTPASAPVATGRGGGGANGNAGGTGGGGGNGSGGLGGGTSLATNYTYGGYTYKPDKPHAIESIDGRPYQHDLNGNTTGWQAVNGDQMTLTWDAANRLTSVTDGRTTNRFAYDDAGRLAIVRGIGAPTAFINAWYTQEAGVGWKVIWLGNDRIAAKQVRNDGLYENQQFLFHENLQGSTNAVTDVDGKVFLRFEYFPSGEPWFREASTLSKTPNWFTGAYLDPDFNLLNHGDRWYDFRTEQMLSPDPALNGDPGSTVGDPDLLPAYSYAASNPLTFADRTGRRYTPIGDAESDAFLASVANTTLPPLPAPPRPTAAHGAPPRPSTAPPTAPAAAASNATAGPTGQSAAAATSPAAVTTPAGPKAAPPRPGSPAPMVVHNGSGRFYDPRPRGMRMSKADADELVEIWEAKPLFSLGFKKGNDGRIHVSEVGLALITGKLFAKTFTFNEKYFKPASTGGAPARPTQPLPAMPAPLVNPADSDST